MGRSQIGKNDLDGGFMGNYEIEKKAKHLTG